MGVAFFGESSMQRVLIADDHSIIREGLKQILSENLFIQEIDEASNGDDALQKLLNNDYDLAVLDVSMPGKNGIEVLKNIKKEKPELHVLILSMHSEQQYAVRALRAGASAYLTKNSVKIEIAKALEYVVRGDRYVSKEFSDILNHRNEIARSARLHEKLSDREFQVLRLIASGKTVTDIAKKLSLSVQTISTYRTRIMQKMNMRNNSELTFYAIRKDLL
jgi:two-component system invasion response regulator UvrY